jgi:hypothetical protein
MEGKQNRGEVERDENSIRESEMKEMCNKLGAVRKA